LHEDIEDVAICVDCAPEPVLLATDRNHDFVQVPLVVRPWSIPADAIREIPTNAIDPKPDRFPLTVTPRTADRSSTSAVLRAKRW
jgi:hypothetical protein